MLFKLTTDKRAPNGGGEGKMQEDLKPLWVERFWRLSLEGNDL